MVRCCSNSHAGIMVDYTCQGNVQHMERCVGCGKTRHFKKVCHSRRERAVNEIEVEAS